MPVIDSSSVRGIGVAVSVSTSTLARIALMRSLCVHAEALLLVDHEQTEVLELHVLGEQPVGADHDVDVAATSTRGDHRASARSGVRKRESTSTRTG